MNASPTLLIVDDELDTLDLCCRIFRGRDLIIASSGPEALVLIKGREIDAALVDQRMPHMSGLDVLIELYKTHPAAARIVITAFTELDDIVALINQGRIHSFVVKPWNNHQLRLTVDREIENVRQAREIRALHERLQREHGDMLSLLTTLDPEFRVPNSNGELNQVKQELRSRVAGEVERLFLQNLFAHEGEGPKRSISEAARAAKINRTFLHRLLERHGLGDTLGGPEFT